MQAGDRVMLNLGPSAHYRGTTGTIRKIERDGEDIFVQWDGGEEWYHTPYHWLKPIGPDHPSMTMTEASEKHMTEWRISQGQTL